MEAMCTVLRRRIRWMNNFSRLFARIMCKKQYETFAEVLAKLEKEDLEENFTKAEITHELQSISRGVILDKIGMWDVSLITYILSLKYYGKVKILPYKNDIKVVAGSWSVANKSFMTVYIHFIDVKDNILRIEGNISWPTVFKENYAFGVKNNGTQIPVRMFNRNLDLKKGRNIYETRTVFVADVPLAKEANRIEFCNYIKGHEYTCDRIISLRFAPVADCIKHQYCIRDNWMLRIEEGALYCEEAEAQNIYQLGGNVETQEQNTNTEITIQQEEQKEFLFGNLFMEEESDTEEQYTKITLEKEIQNLMNQKEKKEKS